MSELSLPLSVEGVDAPWLSQALGVEVTEVTVRHIVWGTATKVLVDVTYAADPGDLPTQLCVKGGFVPELRAIMAPGYAIEASFYADIAPALGAGAARCHASRTDPETGQSIVILDDLTAVGAEFCDARQPLHPDDVAQALETLAGWHSRADLLRPWLSSTPNFRAMVQGLWNPAHWDAYSTQTTDGRVLELIDDPDRIASAFAVLWAFEDEQPSTFVHGDANLTNVVRDATGRLGFLDWQFACRTDPLHDVGLFLIGALAVEDRRSSEEDLLRTYLDARGDGRPSWDDAWLSYRAHTLHGAMYALTPEEMQPADVRDALAGRYAAAALDHDTFRVIGV